jgi:transcriptional regulator with XRE-family HTH domain
MLAHTGLENIYYVAMEIKDWVRAARANKGWTLQQLGEQLGRTKANVGHWETGKHSPSYVQLLKISDLTGLPLPGSVQLQHLALGPLTAEEPPAQYGSGLLEDLNDLLPEDADRFRAELEKHAKLVEQLRAEIHARAEQMRRHSRYLLTKTGAKGVASAEQVKHIPVAPKVGDPEGGAGKGERRGRSHVPPEPSPSQRP